ncbi:alpha/beta hydrolase [Kurthia sibirica]|nr:phospholipase [Kurthia sibirica]GEK33825.1 hypothetical protein KSI01_13580 [Kurthia sibirica]
MNYFSIESMKSENFVLFHGTGGNEFSLLQIAGDLNPEAGIISFIGDVGEGVERRFFKRLKDGQLDRQDFEKRVDLFLAQWDKLAIENSIFIGYSNGANFILGILEKRPDLAKRILLLHPSNLGYTFAGTSNSEIIMTTGAMDGLAVPGDVMKLSKQLAEYFPQTTLKLIDGGHEITNAEIDYLQQVIQ